MRTLFWTSALVVGYTYAGYPLLMAALARFFPKPWKQAATPRGVTILMAVHNGGHILPAKMRHLFEQDRQTVRQIIVVSDGSTDGTISALYQCEDDRLEIIELTEQIGKSSALNHGLARAKEEIVLFMDLRPRMRSGALEALLRNFADPNVGCVAGELILRQDDAHEHTASAVGGLYWKYEQAIRNWEAAFDSPVGVYGGFYAVRRRLAMPVPEGLILDDMFQPLSIIHKGYRSVLDRSAVVEDTWPATTRGEFLRKVRTLAGNFQLVAEASWTLSLGNRVLFQFVSHKLMRLLVPYAFVSMLVSAWALAPHSPFWMALAIVQSGFWAMALASLRTRLPVVHRIAAPAGALLVLNAAAVVGLYRFLFTTGPLWSSIWSPTPVLPREQHAQWQGEESA